MSVDRETVHAALFDVGSAITFGAGRTWVTKARRIQHYAKMAPSEKPAFFQVEYDEPIKRVAGLPAIRVWKVVWVIYHCDGIDPAYNASTTNNQIVQAVDDALEPDNPENRYTIGGQVFRCFIDGTVFKDPGDLDQNAMIMVPLSIVVP